MKLGAAFPVAVTAFMFAAAIAPLSIAGAAEPAPKTIKTVPGMPPVVDPNNLCSETRPEKLSPTVAKHLTRVYVPARKSHEVTVIGPATFKVIDRYPVGRNPQHVVPSWDLKTLWVNNNAEHRAEGSVTPINLLTGKPGTPIPVDDPYNTAQGRESSRRVGSTDHRFAHYDPCLIFFWMRW